MYYFNQNKQKLAILLDFSKIYLIFLIQHKIIF